jgi:AAA15 family ATPase/GTPase
MIKSLEIKNVLSHKDAKLEFCPGVNVIVGPSDHGKSALFHAFNWGAFNRPTGEAHRNWDGGTMLSKISFTEGGSVTLEKDKQGKSKLYSLEEYQTRFDNDIRRGYLSGRFGGLPLLTEFDNLSWLNNNG